MQIDPIHGAAAPIQPQAVTEAPPAGLPPGPLPQTPAQAPVGSLAGSEPPVQELPPVTHDKPILTTGASGANVEELCRLLAACGYATNSIVRGLNPHLILDDSVMADVRRFCADHGVSEPADLFAGTAVPREQVEGSWIGPHTWQALYDAAAKAIAG